jgi:phospholipase C
MFLLAGTAAGIIDDNYPLPGDHPPPTIFDSMDAFGIDWKYYAESNSYPCTLLVAMCSNENARFATIGDYERDLAAGALPSVAFLEAAADVTDEHPPANVEVGQAWMAARIAALTASRAWSRSVLFVTFDEGGSFYDHVAPPRACAPDGIAPRLALDDYRAAYDRYGFRVPLIAVSPYAKRHYVAHAVYDHTSLLRFIEVRFNLPALGARDANADPLLDLFDFDHPSPAWTPPRIETIDPCTAG